MFIALKWIKWISLAEQKLLLISKQVKFIVILRSMPLRLKLD
ncbi:hypothetical protein N480_25000 [Pseudoalteromonas luteoviolacea S2607]|nr:hypothetical protein N480_25000 [Pseudoalteromonas luteoviolacea S2607]